MDIIPEEGDVQTEEEEETFIEEEPFVEEEYVSEEFFDEEIPLAEEAEAEEEEAEEALAANYNIYDTFTDDDFYDYIIDSGFDKNNDGYLSQSEINEVTTISVRNKGICNFQGLNIFTELKELNIGKNSITSTKLDLSGLKKLEKVTVDNCNIYTLTLGDNTNLKYLKCSNNKLVTLYLKGCTNLEELICANNSIYSLDLSGNTKLYYVDVSDCQNLSKIDITELPLIKKTFLEGREKLQSYIYKYTLSVDGVSCTFFVNKSCTVLCPRWVEDGNYWKYMKADGTYVVDDWNKIDGKWYHFDSSGHMETGWKKIDNIWYYFGDNGPMRTSWQLISGKWYFFTSGGAMKKGWVKLSGKWYYFDGSGAMKTGWVKSGAYWYHMDSNGVMQTGWFKQNNKWYYFDSNGQMVTTSVVYQGKTYNFNSDGTCKNP